MSYAWGVVVVAGLCFTVVTAFYLAWELQALQERVTELERRLPQ